MWNIQTRLTGTLYPTRFNGNLLRAIVFLVPNSFSIDFDDVILTRSRVISNQFMFFVSCYKYTIAFFAVDLYNVLYLIAFSMRILNSKDSYWTKRKSQQQKNNDNVKRFHHFYQFFDYNPSLPFIFSANFNH